MPTYEYECTRKHRFELFQSITEKPARKCPKCKSAVRRLISSGAGFLFKGSGFYQTDYRSADYKKKSEAEKQGHSKPDAKKEAEKPKSKETQK